MNGIEAADKVLVVLRDLGQGYNCLGCISKAAELKPMHVKPILDTLVAMKKVYTIGTKTKEYTIALSCWGCMSEAVTYSYAPRLRDLLNPSYHFPPVKKSTSLKKDY